MTKDVLGSIHQVRTEHAIQIGSCQDELGGMA